MHFLKECQKYIENNTIYEMAKLELLTSPSEFSLKYEFVEDLTEFLIFVPGRQATLSIEILSIIFEIQSVLSILLNAKGFILGQVFVTTSIRTVELTQFRLEYESIAS